MTNTSQLIQLCTYNSPYILKRLIVESAANGYRSIASINLNIDGDIIELQPSKGDNNTFSSDDIYVKTHRSYKVSLELLKRIEQSANTVIIIVTDVGVIETNFNDSRAYLGMVNFNKQVIKRNQHKNTIK